MIAIIFGVSGQDGSYLAEFLLRKGYIVHGVVRPTSEYRNPRIEHLLVNENDFTKNFFLHRFDVTNLSQVLSLVRDSSPTEIYNLAAQSHVGVSFSDPSLTIAISVLGTINCLEAIKLSDKPIKYYQASSSEMYGSSPPPQNENTEFRPRSPYAIAKLSSYWLVKNYRESYGIFSSNGILFNHESPRRGTNFVTRKISQAAVEIYLGKRQVLSLGNLDSIRDWGFATEYVDAMWRILQYPRASDFVIGTGVGSSVEEFLDLSFSVLNLDWRKHVIIDQNLIRPSEVNSLIADASLAHQELGWKSKMHLTEIASKMVFLDLKLSENPNLAISDAFVNYWE